MPSQELFSRQCILSVAALFTAEGKAEGMKKPVKRPGREPPGLFIKRFNL